jgi:hypothetical protein
MVGWDEENIGADNGLIFTTASTAATSEKQCWWEWVW